MVKEEILTRAVLRQVDSLFFHNSLLSTSKVCIVSTSVGTSRVRHNITDASVTELRRTYTVPEPLQNTQTTRIEIENNKKKFYSFFKTLTEFYIHVFEMHEHIHDMHTCHVSPSQPNKANTHTSWHHLHVPISEPSVR